MATPIAFAIAVTVIIFTAKFSGLGTSMIGYVVKKIPDNVTSAPQIAAIRNQMGAPDRMVAAPKIGIANITK